MVSYDFKALGYRLVMTLTFQLFSVKYFPISKVADCRPPITGRNDDVQIMILFLLRVLINIFPAN
tara:strand:- start:488 stop:682 length:195 start_codon:yes stop_codon:yes gene_type:complete